MEKSIRGQKRVCSNCNTKFFDFNKEKIICPNCKTEIIKKKTIPIVAENIKIKNEVNDLGEDVDLSEEVEFDDSIKEVIDDETLLEKE